MNSPIAEQEMGGEIGEFGFGFGFGLKQHCPKLKQWLRFNLAQNQLEEYSTVQYSMESLFPWSRDMY